MHELQLRDAKATLPAVIDQARQGEPCVITRHGKPAAVVPGFEDWQRLANVPSFGRLLIEAGLEPDGLPAITIAEVQDGIAKARREGALKTRCAASR